jgi:capsular exopolysaccharide synthesis family protein
VTAYNAAKPDPQITPITQIQPKPKLPFAGYALPGGGFEPGVRAWPTPAVSSGPDASTLMKALQRRWLLAACLGVLAAAVAGVAAWFLMAPKYTVTAQMKISSVQMAFINRNGRDGQPNFATYGKTVANWVRNRHVLNAALKDPKVKGLALVNQQADPILWLEDELKVDYPEGSEIVKISMMGTEPADLITIVDAVAKAYLAEMSDLETKERDDHRGRLENAFNKAQAKLRAKQESLQQRLEGAGETGAAKHKYDSLTGSLTEISRDLGNVRLSLGLAQKKLANHKARETEYKDASIPPDQLEAALDAESSIKGLTDRRLKIQDELAAFEAGGLRKTDIKITYRRKQLELLNREIDERRNELQAKLEDRYRKQTETQHKTILAQLEDDVAVWSDHEKPLIAEKRRLEEELTKFGNPSAEIEILRGEIAQDKATVDNLAFELNTARAEASVPARITAYQDAAIQKKDIKRQMIVTIMAPLAALTGVCLCIGWWEFRARRIHSADEVVKGLGMRVVGAVPPLPQAARSPFGAVSDRQDLNEHNLLESIDSIRTVLLRDATVTATRVVMVTSATDGEGKTTLAGYLATSLARAGRRTLLVDCDLRRPSAHQLFEQALQPGLSEVLLKEIELAGAIRPTTAMEGLWLLPAGQWDREVLQALAQEGPQRIFDQLRQDFDFVVVDSSPVLAATDSLLVGQHVDAVILSLLRDVSQVPTAYEASQRMTTLGIRVLGAVVNGLNPDGLYRNGYHLTAAVASR